MALTLDDLVDLPLPGLGGPSQFRFAPSGDPTWAAPVGAGRVQVLWTQTPDGPQVVFDPGDLGGDESALPHEERLRRERLRERALGVTVWSWSERGSLLVVPIAGEVWARRGLDGPPWRLLGPGAQDARPSPDGSLVGFVRDAELHVVDVATGAIRALTSGAKETGRTHGLAEYVAQEEMNRQHGWWWAPRGDHIAYCEVDETHVPVWRIPHEGRDVPSWEDHRYPFAGAANAIVNLHVVRLADGRTTRMDLRSAAPDHEYVAWVRWRPDGKLVAALQDRRQTRLWLAAFDVETGVGDVFHEERSDTWINLHDGYRPLRDGSYLWLTEDSGFQHVVRVMPDGTRKVLTSGPWMVDVLHGASLELGVCWVTATEASPLERHLYEVPLDGGPVVRRTPEPGTHVVAVDARTGRFVDTLSTLRSPPRASLRDRDGAELVALYTPSDPRVTRAHTPELHHFRQRDGVELHGALWRPDSPPPWPLVVAVYGGPHAQRVADRWDTSVDLRAAWLRERGVAVWKCDNRGSARRGLAFEAPLRHLTGPVEVADQVDGVAYLVREGLVDPARVGITGWSYGGYVTAMALCLAPDVFRAGVAGAPVTHWDGYDTHYTERYMGLPAENPDGYRDSSVMAHAKKLQSGALMLVHGMLDENVHFRHTARLINALLEHRKDYALALFPDERHLPRKPADRRNLEARVITFLLRALGVDVPVA